MSKLALLGGSKLREKPFMSAAVIEEEERRRVAEVLDSGMLSGFIAKAGEHFLGGKQVREFEALVGEYFSCTHVVAVNSATAALHAGLGACGIGPGDEVIVTPYTMSASATAIVMLGGVPVFADIEPETFGLDPAKVKAAISPRTKAIVVVHLFGHPARMNEILEIARQHDLRIIEDCAQAPGAVYRGKKVGLLGDVGVFSLNQHKTITCGEGGFAVTRDERLAVRMQLIRNHGEVVVEDLKVEDIDNIIGYNYRMTELEAAVAIGQFRRLDSLNDHRIQLAEQLAKGLQQFEGLSLPMVEKECSHVYFVFPVKYDERKVGVSRDVFVKALVAEGIPFGAGYVRPIYLEPLYQKKVAWGKAGFPFNYSSEVKKTDYSKGLCPVVERMHEKELLLTGVCKYPHTSQDIDDVVRVLGKVFENLADLKDIN